MRFVVTGRMDRWSRWLTAAALGGLPAAGSGCRPGAAADSGQGEAAPVLVVNTEHLNFEEGDEDFALLLQRIEEMRGPREFFSRG